MGDTLREAFAHWPRVTPEVAQLLDSLPWRQRATVILTHGQGHTCAEVADRLGVSGRTVRRDLRAVAEGLKGTDNDRR